MLTSYALLIVAGLLGGFLAGLLGVGGGVIFVFVLSVFFEAYLPAESDLPKLLISNSIFATFFAGVSSSLKNRKTGTFYLKEVLLCAFPGTLSALILTWTITEFNWYSKERFTVFFVGLLLFFLVRLLKKSKPSLDEAVSIKPIWFVIIGLFAGVVSGLSGLGGGIVMVPIMTEMLRIPIRKAASISLGVIPFFAFSMSLFYGFTESTQIDIPFSWGYIVFGAALPLAFGVIVAAPLGVTASKRLSPRVIKVMFASVIAIVVLKMVLSII